MLFPGRTRLERPRPSQSPSNEIVTQKILRNTVVPWQSVRLSVGRLSVRRLSTTVEQARIQVFRF